jgi:radical SAM protein with 4Fe4S-binding SPASM domain
MKSMAKDPSNLELEDLEKNQAFCILPWTHMSLQPNGDLQTCCHFDRKSPTGNLSNSSVEELWNSASLRSVREQMLAGKMPSGCWECKELDKGGTESLRKRSNWKYLKHHWEVVKKTESDGSLPKLNIVSLNLRFSNKCNLRCRTCKPANSTGWYRDAKLLGHQDVPDDTVVAKPKGESFLEQIKPHLHTLESVHITGGEPLQIDEHYELLSLLLKEKLTHVHLDYNTNLSKLIYGKFDIIKLWKKFEKVSIDASLDGSEARGEYLRKNLSWSKAVANVRRIRTETPHVNLGVHATLSLMNALHLPDFHKYLVEEDLIPPHRFVINPLMGPRIFRAQLLPSTLKSLVRSKYENHIENFIRPRLGENSRLEDAFRRALVFIMAQDQSKFIPEFLKSTIALDFIRNENFFEIFPELSGLSARP